MTVLIHDMADGEFSALFPNITEDVLVISNHRDIKRCSECFHCWTKTPGVCKIKDKFTCLGKTISACSEIVVISKSKTGDFSPFVKNVLKRSLCFLCPNRQDDSESPYERDLSFTAYFYGRTTDKSKEIIAQNVRTQALTFKVKDISIHFSKRLIDVPAEMENEAC